MWVNLIGHIICFSYMGGIIYIWYRCVRWALKGLREKRKY